MLNEDLVYYLIINDEFMFELCFESEAEAIEYAETNAIRDYQVYEWNVE